MNSTPTSEADVPRTLAIPEELHELLSRSVPMIIKDSGESPEEAICRMLTMGFTECLRAQAKLNERKLEIIRRADEVDDAVRKMTDEMPCTDAEVDLIWLAAKAGHVRAGILVDDFIRFGRSMNRGKEAK